MSISKFDEFDVSTDYLLGRMGIPKFKSRESMNVELVQAAMDLLCKALKRNPAE